jgi:signal transduction histidine kinase
MEEQVFSRREKRGIDVSEFKRTGSGPDEALSNFEGQPAVRPEPVAVGSLTEPAAEERLNEEKAPQPQAGLERAVALAHELSQPLEAIAGYAQAGLLQLRRQPIDVDKLTSSFEKIALQVQSAAEILREVREAR